MIALPRLRIGLVVTTFALRAGWREWRMRALAFEESNPVS